MRLTKQIVLSLFLMIGINFSNQLEGQARYSLQDYLSTTEINDITYNAQVDLYNVSPLRLSALDYWARKGILLDKVTANSKALVDQVTQVNKNYQQIIIEYQNKAANDSVSIVSLSTALSDCNKDFNSERKDRQDYQDKYLNEKGKKNFWIGVALVEAALIAAAIILSP